MVVQIRYDHADEFCLAVRENSGYFILFIIQFLQRIGDNLLIFQSERIRIIEITGNRCFGKMGIFRNVTEGYVFLGSHNLLLFSSLEGTEITLLNTKAEIQVALEKMGAAFEEKSGVHVEVMPVTDGDSPYTKMVSLYNSGNPPTLAILDTTDVIALAEEKAADLTEEPWTAEAEEYLTRINGKVYSFPLCIEGRGLIYNKKVIEGALGEEFDPKSVTTLDEFVGLLDRLVDAGIEKPVSLAKEDWSLGAHHLQYMYETYDGTSEGAAKIIEELKNGDLKVESYDRVYELLDIFDVLKKYNVAKGDPLGADYDEMAIDLADGKTAFWFNGNWAWPNLEEAGAESEDEYGFLPYFMNNDPDDFVNCRIQASPSKQVMNDHWSILGSAMQKYLAGRSDREELIESIQDYWDEQE